MSRNEDNNSSHFDESTLPSTCNKRVQSYQRNQSSTKKEVERSLQITDEDSNQEESLDHYSKSRMPLKNHNNAVSESKLRDIESKPPR
jgi:hypothetical protein